MSRVVLYTGQAGTGKTTSLINLLKAEIPSKEWEKFETVLALTFMHGSRRRLENSLKFVKNEYKVRYECLTIDSFSLHLVNRFRCYLDISKPILPGEVEEETLFEYYMSYDNLRSKVVKLLKMPSVQKFISNTYPIVVVDEFQDCVGELLEIIKGVSNSCTVFIASDPFQQLSDPEDLEGIRWVTQSSFEHNNLDSVVSHRTSNSKILLTATCLRSGVLKPGKKIDIFPCAAGKGGTYPLAEYHLKANIHYNLSSGNVAIISPTSNCPFVKRLMKSLENSYQFKKPPYKVIGPYSHLVQPDLSLDENELLENIPKQRLTKNDLGKIKLDSRFVIKRAVEKLLRKMTIRNTENIEYDDFVYVLKQTIHTYNNFYQNSTSGRILSSTIHGAKNREFDCVIVLWSYKAFGSLLQRRKLLYNAVTRAKKNAVIIVQHKNNDLGDLGKSDLFSLLVGE